MHKISVIVEKILVKDLFIVNLASRDLLNYSAYAKYIRSQVEDEAKREVSVNTIATAISRVISSQPTNINKLSSYIQDVTVHNDIAEVTYTKNPKILEEVHKLYKHVNSKGYKLYTITQGVSEITIIGNKKIVDVFLENLDNTKILLNKDGLIGITIKFDMSLTYISNFIFSIVRLLALKNINIVEIVSTTTELTLIIDSNDVQVTMEQLQKIL